MSFSSVEITYLRKEEQKHYLYHPPAPPPDIFTVKALRNSKVTYVIKEGKEVNHVVSQ